MDLHRRELLQLLGATPATEAAANTVTINNRSQTTERPNTSTVTFDNWSSHTYSADFRSETGHYSLQQLQLLNVDYEPTGNPNKKPYNAIYGADDAGCWRYTFSVSGATIAHTDRETGGFDDQLQDYFNGEHHARGINLDAKIGSKVRVEAGDAANLEHVTFAPRHGTDSYQVFTTADKKEDLKDRFRKKYDNAAIETLEQYYNFLLTANADYIAGRRGRPASRLPFQSNEAKLSRGDVYKKIREIKDTEQDVDALVNGTFSLIGAAFVIGGLVASAPVWAIAGSIIGIGAATYKLLNPDNTVDQTQYYNGFRLAYPKDEAGPMTNHKIRFDVLVPPGKSTQFKVDSQNQGKGINRGLGSGRSTPKYPSGEWFVNINAPPAKQRQGGETYISYHFDKDTPGKPETEVNTPQAEILTTPDRHYSILNEESDSSENKIRTNYRPIPGFVFNIPVFTATTTDPGESDTLLDETVPVQCTAENSLLTDNQSVATYWRHGKVVGDQNLVDGFLNPGELVVEPKMEWTGEVQVTGNPRETGLHAFKLKIVDGSGRSITTTRPYEVRNEALVPAVENPAQFQVQTDGLTITVETLNGVPDEQFGDHSEPLRWYWTYRDSEASEFAFDKFGTGPRVRHTLKHPGRYTIHHLVVDNNNRTYINRQTITVAP